MGQLTVITGTSRGLGAALARQCLARGDRVLALARTPNPSLATAPIAAGGALEQWTIDLADAPAAAARLAQWLSSSVDPAPGTATLINNAALLAKVGPVDALDPAELVRVLRVDIEAPILLTHAFLHATRNWRSQRRVLQISSGASSSAYAGWSTYCAAKAALDHFARAASLDEGLRAAAGTPAAQIVSLAPGIIDTAMQAQLRSADDAAFPNKQRFVELHQRGQLAAPEDAAARILAYLARPDFGAQAVADIRTA